MALVLAERKVVHGRASAVFRSREGVVDEA